MSVKAEETPPILAHKHYSAASAFKPENLLREARRQKGLPAATVPEICILDPDGDMVRYLCDAGLAGRHPSWACYHTDLFVFREGGYEYGILGCVVGAAFAVLVAEELFASGCRFLVSMTSSGQILPVQAPPYFVLIERALRDEGTSYHYLPPSDYAQIDRHLLTVLDGAFSLLRAPVSRGATWTTDAPFRETSLAVEYAGSEGIVAVEMEAAALYAFAQARQKPVVCFAHVTNRMGNVEGDFAKGDAAGSREALQVVAATARAWLGNDSGVSPPPWSN